MDPLADKLLVTAALVSLAQMGLAASWMVVVILGREFAVTLLRAVARAKALPASPIGKVKMAAQSCDSRVDSGQPGIESSGLPALALWWRPRRSFRRQLPPLQQPVCAARHAAS